MRLASLNCGLPREISWRGNSITTSIYKEPVEGRVALRTLNLDGDRQSDLTVHGGKDKAVYCYPVEHYEYWKSELPGRPLPLGVFGENFSIQGGLSEDAVYIGDRFSIGTAELAVTQPRMPCYKLALRFDMDDMVKRFLHSRRNGFYMRVVREGEVGTGDEVKVISRDSNQVRVSDIVQLYISKKYAEDDAALVRRALAVPDLPESWKSYFQEKLDRSGTG